MPFIYQQNINEFQQLAIWSTIEPISFYEKQLQMVVDIKNEARKMQHMAVRWLLKSIMPKTNIHDIVLATNGKPYLLGMPFHFSFSHCNGFAAVAVSKDTSIGIDIEIIDPRIAKVAHKFLNRGEIAIIEALDEVDKLKQLTFLWAAKEAMYKQHEQLGIDFADDFNVLQLALEDRGVITAQIIHKGVEKNVQLAYHFELNYCCVTCFEN